MSKNSVCFIGPFHKVRGCHNLEIVDIHDQDWGVMFRNLKDGNWPIIHGLIRKDRGQVTVAGSTIVRAYR